jgi:hypothetical protein
MNKYHLQTELNRLISTIHNCGIHAVNCFLFGFKVLRYGQIIMSPGGAFKYKVIGPVSHLFDREELPWPSCSLTFRGKQPSWRRIGRRFVPDIATLRHPSYCVQLLDEFNRPVGHPFITTFFWLQLSPKQSEWWTTKRSTTGLDSSS